MKSTYAVCSTFFHLSLFFNPIIINPSSFNNQLITHLAYIVHRPLHSTLLPPFRISLNHLAKGTICKTRISRPPFCPPGTDQPNQRINNQQTADKNPRTQVPITFPFLSPSSNIYTPSQHTTSPSSQSSDCRKKKQNKPTPRPSIPSHHSPLQKPNPRNPHTHKRTHAQPHQDRNFDTQRESMSRKRQEPEPERLFVEFLTD